MHILFQILSLLCLAGFTVYFLALLYFMKGLKRIQAGGQTGQPTVSVIVPAHNEAGRITETLHALAAQTYPREKVEIVLINDRSADATPKIMEDFADTQRNVQVIHIRGQDRSIAPKKQAILRGIGQSGGELIITTDADAAMHPKWIETLVRHYADDVGLVFGYAPYRTDGRYNTLFHHVLALEYLASGSIAAATAGRNAAITGFGANFSYRRQCFEEVNGFGSGLSQHSGDDDLLLNRVRMSSAYGIRFAAEPEAAVWNIPPETPAALIRQRIRFASKHLAYPGKVIAGLGMIYLLYVLLFFCLVGACFLPVLRVPLLLALGVKTAGELLFLRQGQKLLERRNLLKYYPLAVLPHILYVVVFPVLGQIMPRKW